MYLYTLWAGDQSERDTAEGEDTEEMGADESRELAEFEALMQQIKVYIYPIYIYLHTYIHTYIQTRAVSYP